MKMNLQFFAEEVESTAVKERRMEANYLNIGTSEAEEYELMGTGYTDLNEKPTAQTKDKRYINMKSKSKSIVGYDWSSEFTADQIPSQKTIKYLLDIGKLQKTGADAETDYVLVDLDEKGTGANIFHARKIHVAIEVSDFGNEDGEMTVSGNLLGKSDVVEGFFNTSTKTFSAEEPA